MSDTSAPSAPSGEAPTGRIALEKKHGFTQMATQDGEPARKPKEFDTAKDAGEALAAKREKAGKVTKAPEEIAYRDRDGTPTDPKQAITLERAADDRKKMLDSRAAMADAMAADDTATQVDDARAEAGIAPTEPSQPQLSQEDIAAHHESTQYERDAVTAGLDPALAKTLAHPQARQALESEFKKIAEVQAQHDVQLTLATHFARDAWQSQFPELAGLNPAAASHALTQMQQTNPARFNAAMASLQRVGEMANLQQHHQAQRAQFERKQFEVEAKIQDAAFDRMVGTQTPAMKQAVATEMVTYANELGVDRNTLVHLLQTNPIVRHSAFQKMMHDAISWRLARRNAAKAVRDVPPVQRPGTSSAGVSRSAGAEDLKALARKANASGSLADMAKLLAASRRGR